MIALYLQLKKEFFASILRGEKTIEYRDVTDWYDRKLFRKPYTHIHFRNGYRFQAPEMVIELLEIQEHDCYELHLGKIVSTKNLHLL